jgi:hypothetical protein
MTQAKANQTEIKTAVKKAATFGTAVACGALDGLMVLEPGIKRTQAFHRDDSRGAVHSLLTDLGTIEAGGDLPMYLRYDSIDLLLAACMGTSGNPTYVAAAETGTASAGGATTLTDAGEAWVVNAYTGYYCSITAGTGVGQSRLIASNTAEELTVAAWGVTPDNTSEYVIRKVIQGTATAGGATTLDDTDQAWTVDGLIDRYIIITGGTGSGQSRKITDNTATQVTVEAWTVQPDATSTYEISDTTAVHTHTYSLADDIDGLFLTLAVNNGMTVQEAAGMKVMGFTLTAADNQPAEVSFEVMCDDYVQSGTPATTTNTLATFANVTFREEENRALFSQLVVRLNAQAGSALSGGDAIAVNNIELVYKRPMEPIYATGQSNKTSEPGPPEQPEVTLALVFPKYVDNTYFVGHRAGTAYKADLVFTGLSSRSISIELPNIQIIESDLTTSGIFTEPLKFNLHRALVAPSGMTATGPVQITIVNTFGGDPLQTGN